MSELEPFETRRGISRHLTEEGALPLCEQCNSSGNSKPVEIVSSDHGSISFTVSRMWAHKPYEEADCRYVYICQECFWALQCEVYGGGRTLVCRLGGLRLGPKLSAMPRAHLNRNRSPGNAGDHCGACAYPRFWKATSGNSASFALRCYLPMAYILSVTFQKVIVRG